MTRRSLVALVVSQCVASAPAVAYDSIACGPPDVRADCEGLEAARTPWFKSEHAQIWLRSRVLAGLPDAVDAPFEVETLTLGQAADDTWSTLLPAPIDVANTVEQRTIEISVFSQLPDKSWALWDWVAGNEGCPPLDGGGFEDCHAFTAHMGWLNSNHFLPQAEDAFYHHHQLALERAAVCATMADRVGDHPVVEACDREALLLEAIAHHYLQDAWSMGHMWQRWGSPEIAPYSAALSADAGLISVKALGDAVGRASGIIHGAGAVTGLPDAMCSPDEGVTFLHGDELLGGGGDLFLDRVEEGGLLFDQRELLFGCAAAAMREVYGAGAMSLGPLGPSAALTVDLVDCFPQRATNRAIGLGAAIQLPRVVGDEILDLPIRAVSDAYLAALGLPQGAAFDYLPLTSSILGSIRIFKNGLIDPQIAARWNEDMSGIQDFLRFDVRLNPDGTSLANGAMGPLLSMRPNAEYEGVSSYTDPPLPWRPVPMSGTPEPRVEEAGNLIARTFVDAHAIDWCEAMTRNESHELSLEYLRDECDSEGDTCDACKRFASRHLSSTLLGDRPLCEVIAPGSLVISANFITAVSRENLASQWCINSPRINIVGRGLVSPGDDLALRADVIGLDNRSVNWSTEAGASISTDGVFRSSEPGFYLVSAESIELTGLTGSSLVEVRIGADLVGTWSGDSLSFDGADEVPVGSPGTITFSISFSGDALILDHNGDRFPLIFDNGHITGTNGRTDAGRRDFDATTANDTMVGVITIQETPPSRIEFDVVKR